MIYIAVSPKRYLSILCQGRHAIHPLKEGIDITILYQYQLQQMQKDTRAYCAILDTKDQREVGKWVGIFMAMDWGFEVINTTTWMDYFGLYPDDKKERDNHWMSVARLRYPMMSVKKYNYEAILTACYLHDKYENEKRMVFA